jgi:hypothetical protein
MEGASTATPERTRLREVRLKLLHLHQTLLDYERKSLERTHGRLNSGDLLKLVINHEQFAWLRMISALVVQIDEMRDADEPASAADMINLLASARQLFTASDNQEFQRKYQTALQQEPERLRFDWRDYS